ncbi:MAG: hypothetical protein M3O90_08595 [Actinomycetota bacterium]|nr:hypothetical protein [Actinomycetota bacterium]
MKRILALFALLALAVAAPAAAPAKKPDHKKGHKGSPAKVFKGTFRAVGADGDYSDRKFGKAQLVDGRKNDKLSVHVRKLAPKTTYAYGLYRTAKGNPVCQEGANTGELVTDFTYTPKQTNKAGNFNTNTRSKTFKSVSTESYFVLVSSTKSDGSTDQAIACAALRGKHKKAKHEHGASKHDASAHHPGSKGKGHEK